MRPVRQYGFASQPIPLIDWGLTTDALKAHPDYVEAKSGDEEAAIRLVLHFVNNTPKAKIFRNQSFAVDAIFVAPHAVEATGDNAIPEVLASLLAFMHRPRRQDHAIVQLNKVFHTGADPMQRLIARPVFAGAVERQGRYVLVDDMTTMGGTLADLADYVCRNTGEVLGAVVMASASRSTTLVPDPGHLRALRQRHGGAIRDILGIEIEALTADEAQYLVGFRTTDEFRGRALKAAQERNRRLRARGVFQDGPDRLGD